MIRIFRLLGILLSLLVSVVSSTAVHPKKILSSSTYVDRKLPVRTLLIDNFDSYTYNLWQLLAEVNGLKPYVISNNDFNSNWETLINEISDFDNIVISPGPGSPNKVSDFGLCLDAILKSSVPLLGVCLGHQGLAYAYGGKVSKAPIPMHGRLSKIIHDDSSLFSNIESNSDVVRYHSLIVHDLPLELKATAWTDIPTDDNIDNDNHRSSIIMALEHTSKPQYGVQFHPESIKTPIGRSLISNFKDITLNHHTFIRKHNQKQYNFNINSNSRFPSSSKEKESIALIQDKEVNAISPPLATITATKEAIVTDHNQKIRCVHISSIPIINNNPITTEEVFESLYGNHRASFWLDSEYNPHQNSNNNGSTKIQSRISYMGAIDTDSAYSVEYMGNQKLIQRFSNIDPKEFNTSIFQFIREKLDQESNIISTTTIEEINRMNESTTNTIESYQLPFQISSTLFGYLGYELGLEALHVLNESNTYKQHHHHHHDMNQRYNLSSLSSNKVLINNTNIQLSQPLAVLLYPSRYIAYDHDKAIYYIISYLESTIVNHINDKDINQYKENLQRKAKESGDELVHKLELIVNNKQINHLENNNNHNNINNNHNNNIDSINIKDDILIIPELVARKSKESYQEDIATCLENIGYGETYEVCLTLQFNGPLKQSVYNNNNKIHDTKTINRNIDSNIRNNIDSNGHDNIDSVHSKVEVNSYLDTYKTLRKYNPAPYACYIRYNPILFMETRERIVHEHDPIGNSNDKGIKEGFMDDILKSGSSSSWYKPGGFAVCSTSPECYLKITSDRKITSMPIKGTAKRNLIDDEDDKKRIIHLANDEKAQAENLMIVDLVRNDLGRVCEIGSVHVPKLMNIETYASVHQMVSTISGVLTCENDVVDAIIATFPGGSMTGAPKMRTMDLISRLEGYPRGIYSGTIGYIGLNGVADLNIVIRTALVCNNTITIGAGGAIVALSNPEEEVKELLLKAKSVSNALGYTIKFPEI